MPKVPCQTPNRALLVGVKTDGKSAIFLRPRCKVWACESCAVENKREWVGRVRYGASQLEQGKIYFLTITSHEKLKTFNACYRVFQSAWPKLYAAMKRVQPDLQYALIPEKHKDGRMHAHLITDLVITERWLKDNARKRGLGYQADVLQLNGTAGAAAYAAKYIGKGLVGDAVPTGFRRIRLSQEWPAAKEFSPDATWTKFATVDALYLHVRALAAKGILTTDLETKQPFDIFDLVAKIESGGVATDGASPLDIPGKYITLSE